MQQNFDFKLSPCFEYCIVDYSTPILWRWNWQRVLKRRQITIWCRGNTQKNTYSIILVFVDGSLYYRGLCNPKWQLLVARSLAATTALISFCWVKTDMRFINYCTLLNIHPWMVIFGSTEALWWPVIIYFFICWLSILFSVEHLIMSFQCIKYLVSWNLSVCFLLSLA
jgi:hypothetical protein